LFFLKLLQGGKFYGKGRKNKAFAEVLHVCLLYDLQTGMLTKTTKGDYFGLGIFKSK